MTKAFVQSLLQQGEGLQIEFKESFSGLNRDTFESICAFLNRKGGHLVLGVTNAGKVEGVLDAEELKMAIINNVNNPQKLAPVFPLSPEIIDFDGKDVIYVYVPESSMVHNTAGKTFDCRGDADLDISRQPSPITELHLRKGQSFTENKVYPYLRLEDLRADLIDRARRLARGNRPGHPWLEMNDEELLRSAGLHQRDYAAGTEGYTLAAALLFGKDEVILSIVPAYKTDAILRVKNLDRYDDRDDVRTNLIEAYDRLMAFIAKHLPDPFFQELDATRVSLRDKIFREVIANMLVHREYASHYPARLVIERDRVTAENWNKPHGHGLLKPDSFTPFTKNPVLARFFREIGRMDELGSGVRNLFRYGPAYGVGRVPEVLEEDVFKTIVPIDPDLMEGAVGGVSSGASGGVHATDWSSVIDRTSFKLPLRQAIRERLIVALKLIEAEPGINLPGLVSATGLTENRMRKVLSTAFEAGLIEFRGSTKARGYFTKHFV